MNGKRKFLVASVLSIQDSYFTYPACQNCFSRVIRTSKRYECHRCHSTSKDAPHRYKLSMKVAEGHRLYMITAFGSCLDAFFGTSAVSLQRYMQDLIQAPSNLASDRVQELLFQAVEYCFVGRSFLFGVKIPGNQSEQPSIHSYCLYGSNRHMVACQIALTHDDPIGYTVFNYYNQLLKSLLNGNQITDSSSIPAHNSSIELTNLCTSDSNHGFHSSGNHPFFEFWQQSFGLTSSSLVDTSRKSSACAFSSDLLKRAKQDSSEKYSNFKCASQTSQDFLHNNSSQEKVEDILLTSPSSTPNTNALRSKFTSESVNTSSLVPQSHGNKNGCSPLHNTSSIQGNCSKSKITSRQENSWSSVSCVSQVSFLCTLDLSSKNVKAAGTSQDEAEVWDDFLFSESLSEFIARVENGKDITSQLGFKTCESHFNAITDCSDARLSRTSLKLTRTPIDLLPQCTTRMLPQKKQNVKQDRHSAFCDTKHNSVCEDERNALHASHFSLISKGVNKLSSVLYPQYQTNMLPYEKHLNEVSPASDEHRIPVHKLATQSIQTNSIYKISRTSLNRTPNQENMLCSQQKENSVYICTKENGNQEMYCVSQSLSNLNSENTLLANKDRPILEWKQSCFDLKGKPINENRQTSEWKVTAMEGTRTMEHPLKSSDNRYNESYNASADLFDTIDTMQETTAELPPLTNDVSMEGSFPEENNKYSLDLIPLVGNSVKSTYTDVNAYSSQRFHALSTYLQSDYEAADEDVSHVHDFIPYSQSTPVAKQDARLGCLGVNGQLLKNASHVHDSIPYSQLTPVAKQPTKSGCLGVNGQLLKKSSNGSSGIVFSIRRKCKGSLRNCLRRKMAISLLAHKPTMFCAVANEFPAHFQNTKSPILTSFTSDSEECIPPSSTKLLVYPTFVNSEMPRLGTKQPRREFPVCKAARKRYLLENKANYSNQAHENLFSTEMKTCTSYDESPAVCNNASEKTKEKDRFLKNTLNEIVKLSPTNCLSLPFGEIAYSLAETNNFLSDWSPELFSQISTVSQQCNNLQRRLF